MNGDAAPEAAVDAEIALSLPRILKAMTPRVWTTWVLVAINIGVYMTMRMVGDWEGAVPAGEMLRWGGVFGPEATEGRVWPLVASNFLHWYAFHLVTNVAILALAGYFVERLVGSSGMIATYLLTGIAGALASVLWEPSAVTAGASGSVYGVFGCLFGFYLVQRRRFPSSVLGFIAGGAVAVLAYSFVKSGAPNTGWAAHIGGGVAGLLCGALLAVPLDASARGMRARKTVVTSAVIGVPLVAVTVWMQSLVCDPRAAYDVVASADRAAIAALAAVAGGDADAVAAQVRERIASDVAARSVPAPHARLAPAHAWVFERAGRALELRRSAWDVVATALPAADAAGIERALALHERADDVRDEVAYAVFRFTGASLDAAPDMRGAVEGLPAVGAILDDAAAAEAQRLADERYQRHVENVLDEHMPALYRCYERRLAREPELAGTVTVDLAIAGYGRVERAAASGLGADVDGCMAKLLRAARFEPREDGTGFASSVPIGFAPE